MAPSKAAPMFTSPRSAACKMNYSDQDREEAVEALANARSMISALPWREANP